MNRPLFITAVIVIGTISVFCVVGFTISSVWIFIPATVISFIIYLRTWYRQAPDPTGLLPLYLLAMAWQFLHFLEEYLTNFVKELPALFGLPPYPVDAWITFNMIAYSVFILGGIILFRKIKALLIIPIFFIITGVMLNAVGHLILALLSGGYFSGLYTALFYLALIPFFTRHLSIPHRSK